MIIIRPLNFDHQVQYTLRDKRMFFFARESIQNAKYGMGQSRILAK